MKLTAQMQSVAMKAKSVEELLELAKQNGLPVTEDEAKEIFDDLNKEGELSDDELDNVAGGSHCVGGKSYSDDPPHYLITTIGNNCDLNTSSQSWKTCEICNHLTGDGGLVLYCKARTDSNDPFNSDIG